MRTRLLLVCTLGCVPLAGACAGAAPVATTPPPTPAHAPGPPPESEAVLDTSSPAGDRVGVLVMAHGGSPEWNAATREAVEALSPSLPTALAYGMADRRSLGAALDSLRDSGVSRVAVVRMFLAGESFLDQTRFYLGLTERPPERFLLMGDARQDPAAREPLGHTLQISTHDFGILDSPHAASVMADRAVQLSTAPENESVLLLAHGMGDETQNQRVLDAMRRVARRISATRPFANVQVATLREDWPDERAIATADLRRFVRAETEAGRRVLVLPMRLSGFGPYAEVLSGLPYEAGEGLLPHEGIGEWLRDTAADVTCSAGWGAVVGPCGNRATDGPPEGGTPR